MTHDEALRALEKEMRDIAPTCENDWAMQLTDWADDIASILTTRQEVAPVADTTDLYALAQEIRRVDGGNTLGAAALAEALLPFIEFHYGASTGQTSDARDAEGGAS